MLLHLLFLLPIFAEDAVFYMDPNGTNATQGVSCNQTDPCASLLAVAQLTQIDDLFYNIDIFLAPGRYSVVGGGLLGLQFFQNSSGAIAFHGNNSQLDFAKGKTVTFYASGLSLIGLNVTNYGGLVFQATYGTGINNFTLRDCDFTDVGRIIQMEAGVDFQGLISDVNVYRLRDTPSIWLSSTHMDIAHSCAWDFNNLNFYDSTTTIDYADHAVYVSVNCDITLNHVNFIGGTVNPIRMGAGNNSMILWNDVNYRNIIIGNINPNLAAYSGGTFTISGSTFSGVTCTSAYICNQTSILQITAVDDASSFVIQDSVFESNQIGLIQTFPAAGKAAGWTYLKRNVFRNNNPNSHASVQLFNVLPRLSFNQWINNCIASCPTRSSCSGGALQISYDNTFNSTFQDGFSIQGDLFVNNSAITQGGHVSLSAMNASFFENVTFIGGRATRGGAIDISSGLCTFKYCTFTDNKASSLYDNIACSKTDVRFINSTINGSAAVQCDEGCSIHNETLDLCPVTPPDSSKCDALCWGLIGGGAALLVIIIAVVCWCCRRGSGDSAYKPLGASAR